MEANQVLEIVKTELARAGMPAVVEAGGVVIRYKNRAASDRCVEAALSDLAGLVDIRAFCGIVKVYPV